jgi:LuxR family transcriptional regulator, maltose regulon positive regulatory protein
VPVSIISSKFYIPHVRENGVLRPRLTDVLLAGVNRPGTFVLLSGPAGFGKSTLLSEFVTQLKKPVVWLSLDEGDNDPVRFWTYLIGALQSVRPGMGEPALEPLKSPLPLPEDAIPTILINDFNGSESDLVLVLDDFHSIKNGALHSAFSFLLDHVPDKLHIVLSTRIDPPWPLARLRVRNQLIEIRAKDLRFTTEEAAAFLNQVMGLNLSAEDVAALETRTEGWIAGLQLAALSMRGRSDIAGFIKAFTGSHVYVAEYLVEEVLQHQPEEVQMFLLQTSILGRLNASLCEAVTGLQEGQAVLAALHRANIFIIPLDDEGLWFRYHQLFADLLQARLRQSLPADAISTLHARASQWYGRNGFVIEAVNHALAAQDFEAAADLIQQNAAKVTVSGELSTLLQWIAALPIEVARRHPQIIISKAWSLTLAGAQPQVESLLREIETQIEFSDETPEVRELRGNAAAIRGYFSMLAGDYARALALTELAEALLPESSVQARSILPYTLGAAYRGQGEYEKAGVAFAHLARIGEVSNELLVWATGETEVVNTRHAQGRLREAGQTARQALRRMADKGALPFGSLAKLEVALCDVLREQNELDEAHQRVTGVIKRMKAWDMPTDRLFAYLTLIRLQEAQGDFTGALETLAIAKGLRSAHPVLMALASSVDIYEIRLLMATQDVSAAARLMDDLRPGTSQMVNIREQELIMLARVRLAQGRNDEVAAILAPLSSDAEAGGRRATLLESLALQARLQDAQGDREAAVTILIKALALAEPEGFVRIFVEEGEGMQSLLVAAARQLESTIDPNLIALKVYAAKLLEAFPSNQKAGAISHPQAKPAGLIEALTSRELEVLQLIEAGDSNRTIAEKLVITVSAVKKHSGNIFGKLNVNSRTQAVARARQLGLLPADG